MTYGVYYYDAAKVGHGMAGTISDTGGSSVTVSPNLNTSLNGDPTAHPFYDPSGNAMFAVTDYTTGTSRSVYIYDYSGTLKATKTWANVQNLYALVRIGNFLYALDYDSAKVVEIRATNPNIYTETGVTWTFTGAPTGYHANGMALAVSGGTLYGLFTIADSTWSTYQNSSVVKFSISAGSSITTAATNSGFEKNAFTLVEHGGYFYVGCIGGKQSNTGYNANSKLQCVQISSITTAPTTVLSAGTALPYEFRDITFNGSTVYVLVGTYNSSWNLAGKLLGYTVSSATSFTSQSTVVDFSGGVAGYFWAALYTTDNSRLWFAKGNELDIVGTSISLGISSLKGTGSYTSLNDMAYVGTATATVAKLRGYRSPVQVSRSKLASHIRALTAGRPEPTLEELEEAKQETATT